MVHDARHDHERSREEVPMLQPITTMTIADATGSLGRPCVFVIR